MTATQMVGRYVRSLAGRGTGRLYVITATVDDNYVLLSDGKTRKQANPKRKKLRHIKLLDDRANMPCTDKELWAQIKNFDLS